MAYDGFSSIKIAIKVGCSWSAVIEILQEKKETTSVVDRVDLVAIASRNYTRTAYVDEFI
jgi:hypothetical protein